MSSFSRRSYRSVEIAVGPAYGPVLGWTALLALAQTTVVPLLAFRGAVPSLVTIAVVLYALRAGARRGALLALPAGAIEDIFAGTAGAWTIASTVVALLAGGFSRRMFAEGSLVPAALCAAAVLIRDLVFWIIVRLEGFPAGYGTAHLHGAVLRATLTAVVAFAWLALRARVVREVTRVERY